MSDHPEHIERLLSRLFDGSLTEAERSELDRLSESDPDLQAAAESIERLSERIPAAHVDRPSPAGMPVVDSARTEQAWKNVARRTGLEQSADRQSNRERPRARVHVLFPRVALVAATVLIAVMGWLWLGGEGGATEWQEVTTDRGQMASLTLPDGSDIRLNAASTLRYRMGDDHVVREVQLDGEALFDVVPGPVPFEVTSSETLIRVLGTRFTVRSRAGVSRIAVQEGRVSVGNEASATVLTQAEAVEVSGEGVSVRLDAGYADRANDWSEGILSFSQVPFEDVIGDVEVRFDATISIDGDGLEEATLSGSFPGHDVSQVLNAICATFGCTVVTLPERERSFRLER